MAEEFKSSREIDIAIGREVMGWAGVPGDWKPTQRHDQANDVRMKMAEMGWQSHDSMTWMGWGEKFNPYGYSFWFQDYHLGNTIGGHAHERWAKDAPRAVCLAALNTVRQFEAQKIAIEQLARSGGVKLDMKNPKTIRACSRARKPRPGGES